MSGPPLESKSVYPFVINKTGFVAEPSVALDLTYTLLVGGEEVEDEEVEKNVPPVMLFPSRLISRVFEITFVLVVEPVTVTFAPE